MKKRGFKLDFDDKGEIVSLDGSLPLIRAPTYLDQSANLASLKASMASLQGVKNSSMFVNAMSIVDQLFGEHPVDEIDDYVNNVEKLKHLQSMVSESTLLVEQPVRYEERIGRNRSVVKPHFQSLVYLIPLGAFRGQILKVYLYDLFLSTEKIIKELAFQQSAMQLEETCSLITPEILGYGFFSNLGSRNETDTQLMNSLVQQIQSHTHKNLGLNIHYVFYVIMENMEAMNLMTLENFLKMYYRMPKPELFHEIATKVHAISECLEEHQVFQNDYNTRNVFIHPLTLKVGLIDYGIAKERESDKSIPTTVSGYQRYLTGRYKAIQQERSAGGNKRRTKRRKKGRSLKATRKKNTKRPTRCKKTKGRRGKK